jgi:hypothetical protein
MKVCLCCGAECAPDAPHCLACGEASFGPDVATSPVREAPPNVPAVDPPQPDAPVNESLPFDGAPPAKRGPGRPRNVPN